MGRQVLLKSKKIHLKHKTMMHQQFNWILKLMGRQVLLQS
jgi:hypothetical protein